MADVALGVAAWCSIIGFLLLRVQRFRFWLARRCLAWAARLTGPYWPVLLEAWKNHP